MASKPITRFMVALERNDDGTVTWRVVDGMAWEMYARSGLGLGPPPEATVGPTLVEAAQSYLPGKRKDRERAADGYGQAIESLGGGDG